MLAEDSRPWAQTKSGRAFPLVDPEPADVHWPDVAYALAHLNRFAGHAGAYSVAQHSILVASNMPFMEWRPYALLHDGHEFVMNDLPTPAALALQHYGGVCHARGDAAVKSAIRKLKWDIDQALHLAAGLLWPVPTEIAEAVHIADIRALVTEKRDLMAPEPRPWGFDAIEPFKAKIEPWAWPERSYDEFMSALVECGVDVRAE